jgi:hypothetical protein
MNAVELSRKAGQLNGFLNRDAMDRLIKAVQDAEGYDTILEPYKTWLIDRNAIKDKDLSYAAKKAKKERA